ncbi:MAG: hypothetical protein KUG65_03230 [Sphingomonadaceae bacterium]|nr:hypothetical protein [Sphingomonadaceae bacterium]
MIQIPRYSGIALLCLVLTSCGSSDNEEDTRQLSAGGNILKGSISDDMLPYDTLRSEAPKAKRSIAAPGTQASGSDEGPVQTDGSATSQAQTEQQVVTDSALPED